MDEMRSAYRAQRGVSQDASITLVSRSGGFSASFGCADRCLELLPSNYFGILEDASVYEIPTEELHASITKLSEQYSVALVDLVTDEKGSRFVLVWKIPARAGSTPIPDQKTEEVVADPNQSTFDLDEY